MLKFAVKCKVVTVFVVIGLLFFFSGIYEASIANAAPTLVGAACFLGIIARIIQAEVHQTETVEIHDDDVEAR